MKSKEQNNNILLSYNQFLTFNDLAKSVCKVIPFSKVVIYIREKDYFCYGLELIDNLISVNLKPITILIKDSATFNTINSLCSYKLFEDVRGIIITDKSMLPLLLNAKNEMHAFCLSFNLDVFGLVNNLYLLSEGRVQQYKIKSKLYFFVGNEEEKEVRQKLIKQLLVIIANLMDLICYKNLFQITDSFYFKLKSLTIDIFFALKEKNTDENKIAYKLFALFNAIYKYNIIFSTNIFSQSVKQNFFSLDCAFAISKSIKEYYNQIYLSEIDEKSELIDNLKGLAFISKLDFLYLLEQVKGQNQAEYPLKELEKLIRLYNDCEILLDKAQSQNKLFDLAKDYFEYITYCPVIKI